MSQRLDYQATKSGPDAMKVMLGFSGYLSKCSIETNLQHLIEYRVSQINACAYCLDMHSKDLRHEGETEQRIYLISAWRETDMFTPREKAALEWAEAVTLVADGNVPDSVFETASKVFSSEELVDLTMITIAINGWNRLNVAFRSPAGSYQPGQHSVGAS